MHFYYLPSPVWAEGMVLSLCVCVCVRVTPNLRSRLFFSKFKQAASLRLDKKWLKQHVNLNTRKAQCTDHTPMTFESS